jgi:hypothetical protein
MEIHSDVDGYITMLVGNHEGFAKMKIDSEAALYHAVRLKHSVVEKYAMAYLREIWRRAVNEKDPVWRSYYEAQLGAILSTTPNGTEMLKKLESEGPISGGGG